MDKFQKHIDNLITKILNEEIENKVKAITEEKGEWEEIEVDEELKGDQDQIDMNHNDEIDAEDFKLLRKKNAKKEEVDEMFFYDDEEIEDAEELSKNEPTYVGKGLEDNKMKADLANKFFGSFDDEHGWFDQHDQKYKGKFDFDYDEEVFPDFDSLMSKYGDKQSWFAPEDGKKFFKVYQDKFGGAPFKIRKMKGLEEEAETEEGNHYLKQRADAIEKGEKTFEVDGKVHPVKEEKKDKKWIQKTDMKKGALHKKLNVPEDEKIPPAKLKKLKKELMAKAEGDKKLTGPESKLLKQVNLALTLKGLKESDNKLVFTEDELIDFIENIVMEQKVKDKDEKDNISKKEPEGLKKTNKALAASKKENDDYAKSVVKKMKDYVKKGSNGEFKESPEEFPENNYQLSDMKEKTKKYHPSDAVDEYIDAFAYPGMTNLVYDEIKPEEEKIERQIKGHRMNGNAEVDESGKALGNVVPSKTGEKFFKNYKDNLYGAEQQEASYKRQPQPVDIAGENKESGSLKSIKKGSANKAAKILNQLESTDKKTNLINEEMLKMKDLINYNRKTQ